MLQGKNIKLFKSLLGTLSVIGALGAYQGSYAVDNNFTLMAASAAPSGFLKVSGKNILTPAGKALTLRGVNMDTYYFMYGPSYPNAPWDYATVKDIQYLKSIGVNSIRLALHWKYFANNSTLGFNLIDTYLNWCEQNGIYVILDMHVVPYEGDVSENSIWNSSEAKQKFLDLWRSIAARYAKRTIVAGYDIYNEPGPANTSQWWELARNAVTTIRGVDNSHIIFLEAPTSNGGDLETVSDKNVVYSFHDYNPFLVTHASATWVSDTPVPSNFTYPGSVLMDMQWKDWSPDSKAIQAPIKTWQYKDSGPMKVPANVEFAELKLSMEGGKGAVWFDDISWSKNGTALPIYNGGMENASIHNANQPAVWNFWTGDNFTSSWDKTVKHAGARSLKIQANDGKGFAVWTQNDSAGANFNKPFVSVKAGDIIQVKGWVYAPTSTATINLGVDYLKGVYATYNRTRLQQDMQKYIDWAKAKNVPLYVGEFGGMAAALKDSRALLVNDKIQIMNAAGISWSLWSYRDTSANSFGLYLSTNKLDARYESVLKAGLK